jgi:hypothetical protein
VGSSRKFAAAARCVLGSWLKLQQQSKQRKDHMFQKQIIRYTFVMVFALSIAAFNATIGFAQDATPQGECQDCHEIVQTHWAEGAHANSVTSQGFQQAWNDQGQPDTCFACHTTGFDEATGEFEVSSVSCTTCHNPEPKNHPDQVMPTDVSSRLCGQCHLETYSNWTESVHAQEDLACVQCHNPHTNEIRAEDSQALCSACHSEEVHFFEYTSHYEEGLLCVDCHVRVLDQPMGEGHGQREHTFTVDMATCSNCHSDDMHYPGPDGGQIGGGGDAGLNVSDVSIQTSPNPVSPFGFALVAILIGAALGMILSPWSERWLNKTHLR